MIKFREIVFLCLITVLCIFFMTGCSVQNTPMQFGDLEESTEEVHTNFTEASPVPTQNEKLTDNIEENYSVPAEGSPSPTPSDDLEDSIMTDDDDCRLVVKGKDITSGNYVKLHNDQGYADLPLTAIMDALGAEIKWEDNITALFAFDGKEYILNIEECSLVYNGGMINILSTPPGGSRYYQVIGNELIIDSTTIRGFFSIIGVSIKLDYSNMVVVIE